MKSFIDNYSKRCLLGQQSKDQTQVGNIFSWKVGIKSHFVITNNLLQEDINYLKQITPSSFYYCTEENYDILKSNFNISRDKKKSTELFIDKLEFCGNKWKTIRNYLNRWKHLEVCDNYKNINDVKTIIDEWSDTLCHKYFRDNSGKNLYFIKNNYHLECDCVFIYDKEKLVSFGIASPVINGYCSYVMGKALAKSHPGLSEFTDVKLYEKLINKYGEFSINMGQSEKGLIFYKSKFPNPTETIHYNGKIL
jgi:hypothetical protein